MKKFLFSIKSGQTSHRKDYINDFIILFLLVLITSYSINFFKVLILDIPMVDKEALEKLNWEKFLSYVLVLPIIEEIIFRAPLLIPRAKIFSLLISIGFIFSFIIYVQNDKIQLSLIGAVIVFEVAYWKSDKLKQFINDFIERKYLFLVIVSSFSFGLLHMGNYESIDFTSFISVIGRIIGGFYFAFIVTKYGLKSSCLMHGINNIIPFIMLLGFEK